jgi:acyl carrier protein
MTEAEIIDRIEALVRDELDDDAISIQRSTRAVDVPGWDSLAHVRIVVAVERAFGVRFPMSAIGDVRDVGGLVDLIRRTA